MWRHLVGTTAPGHHDCSIQEGKKKIELREDLKSRRGLAVSLEIICHNCGESNEDSMNAAVHEAVIANDNNSNIAVAVDGTWHKEAILH
ncbi:hypothetical protein TNCV_3674361 [Trichonephila clavipes]|nr:hypothetical protein TNCV_3674361 [Trichonephila clavipes]